MRTIRMSPISSGKTPENNWPSGAPGGEAAGAPSGLFVQVSLRTSETSAEIPEVSGYITHIRSAGAHFDVIEAKSGACVESAQFSRAGRGKTASRVDDTRPRGCCHAGT